MAGAVHAGEARAAAVAPALLMGALVALAFNLRSTFTSLPPLLGRVEQELGLSGAAAGALTALPVLCMAGFAPAADRFAARYGRERTAVVALVLIALGHGARLRGSSTGLLFAATFVAGVGVAAGGVVLPGLVKEHFAGRAALATGGYLLAMTAGAGLGAFLAVPLEHLLGTWEQSLATWALPPVLALAVWWPVVRRTRTPHGARRDDAPPPERRAVPRPHLARQNDVARPTRAPRWPRARASLDAPPARAPHHARPPREGLPWRSSAAWLLAAFLSAQAALAFAYIGWLPAAYEARGWTPAAAGGLLALMIFGQLFTSLAVPALAHRSHDRRPAIVLSVGVTFVAAAWLWLAPGLAPVAATFLLGLGTGGGIALTLVLLVDYGAGPSGATRLTALVFLVAFSLATIAPILVGALRDVTEGFAAPFAVLTLIAAAQFLVGTRLGPRHRNSVR